MNCLHGGSHYGRGCYEGLCYEWDYHGGSCHARSCCHWSNCVIVPVASPKFSCIVAQIHCIIMPTVFARRFNTTQLEWQYNPSDNTVGVVTQLSWWYSWSGNWSDKYALSFKSFNVILIAPSFQLRYHSKCVMIAILVNPHSRIVQLPE